MVLFTIYEIKYGCGFGQDQLNKATLHELQE